MDPLPSHTRWVIVGAGFAGAATAWALGRAGLGPGIILEQEYACGAQASGRNAGMLRLTESDPLIRALARRSLESIRCLDGGTQHIVRFTGGLTLAPPGVGLLLEAHYLALEREGVPAEILSVPAALARFPFLGAIRFQSALWCPEEAVADVDALLMHYLRSARATGFTLYTGHRAEELLVEGGRVRGVRVEDREMLADTVIDASGAWAGTLGRRHVPLPLQPFRRHVFISGTFEATWPRSAPWVWMWRNEFYVRPESDGLLLSPCDETRAEPGTPPVDPAAADWLALKLARHARGFEHLTLRRSWACLRTFAPDRRPLVGPDSTLPGLFHVSGLGGFGVTASAAIGEVAALALAGQDAAWIDLAELSPARLNPEPAAHRS